MHGFAPFWFSCRVAGSGIHGWTTHHGGRCSSKLDGIFLSVTHVWISMTDRRRGPANRASHAAGRRCRPDHGGRAGSGHAPGSPGAGSNRYAACKGRESVINQYRRRVNDRSCACVICEASPVGRDAPIVATVLEHGWSVLVFAARSSSRTPSGCGTRSACPNW